MSETLTRLPLDRLQPHPENVRGDLGDLHQLTKSVKAQGIIEPLVARQMPDGDYQVIAGHRRLAAAAAAGLDDVPVIVREMDDEQVLTTMLVENLMREDISPLDEARGYFRLIEHGWTQKRLATAVGVSSKTVSQRLKLLDTPMPWVDAHIAGDLSQDGLARLRELTEHPDWTEGLADDHTQPHALERALEQLRIQREKDLLLAELDADGETVVQMESGHYGAKLPRNHRFLPHPDLRYDEDALNITVEQAREKDALGWVVRTVSGRVEKFPVCTDAKVWTRKSSSIPDEERPEGWHQSQARAAEKRAKAAEHKAAEEQRRERIARAVQSAKKSELEGILLPAAISSARPSDMSLAAHLLGLVDDESDDFKSWEFEKELVAGSVIQQLRVLTCITLLASSRGEHATALLDEYAPVAPE